MVHFFFSYVLSYIRLVLQPERVWLKLKDRTLKFRIMVMMKMGTGKSTREGVSGDIFSYV